MKLLETKRNEYHQNKSRLSNGLAKLTEANKEIAALSAELQIK